MMSAVSPSATTRRTLTRGRSRSCDARDDAEQPVAADRQPEQIRVLRPRAACGPRRRVRRDRTPRPADDRLEVQAAAVRVADKRAGDAETIRAGLLLIDAPLPVRALLRAVQIADQLRPLNAAFDGDRAALAVEREHAVQRAHVEEDAGFAELLAAHRVPAAGDRDRLAGRSRVSDAARMSSTWPA